MNHKKYIIGGAIMFVICAVAVVLYYSYPELLTSMVSDASDPIIVASDIDNVSSTDVILPSSTDDDAFLEPVASQKKSSASVTSKKSVENKNDGADVATNNTNITNVGNISVGDAAMNDSTSAPLNIPTPSCSFPANASASLSRKVILNEIAWMGSASSSNAEWMEIKNISGSDIDLDGWQILNASGKISVAFSSGDVIASGGLMVVARNNSSSPSAEKIYSGTLSNAGDVLAVLDPQCNASDMLDASAGWPAGNNTSKQTLERDADNSGWHTSVAPGGTPGAENSFITPPIPKIIASSPPPSASSASPVPANENDDITIGSATTTTAGVTESSTVSQQTNGFTHVLVAVVQIAGASTTNDMVKLYNPTAAPVDMSGWKLHKRSSTGTEYSLKELPTGSVIAPGQYFVWANAANGFSETVAANVSSTETLSADNSVALLDTNGTVVDAVAWGSGTNQFSDGPPYPTDPTNGQLLVRQFANGTIVDTSNNASDFILQ